MSQSRKKRTAPQSEEKAPSSKPIDKEQKGRRTGFVIAATVIAVIAAIIGIFYYSYYREYVAPFHRTIITVDNTSIRMDYFLKRAKITGAQPLAMLESLTNEQLIKVGALKYGIAASQEDIDRQLRIMAGGESGNITESEFNEWYRQKLNESKLSDTEYKEIVAIGLLTSRLNEYVAERMPTVAEQVHPYVILVDTLKEAEKVRARWQAGEAFTDLAREVSLDEETKEKGGDIDWVPRGVLIPMLDSAAFSLSTDNVSEPLAIWSDTSAAQDQSAPAIVGYYLIMVSEKADARELDENSLQYLKSKALVAWLLEETKLHTIKFNYGSEIDAWLNWQLQK